jgi:hypothetical protein
MLAGLGNAFATEMIRFVAGFPVQMARKPTEAGRVPAAH